jgi:GNAT superfamily N-acetyltransferase
MGKGDENVTKVNHEKFEVRVMKQDDLQAIICIDARVTGNERVEYYEAKISSLLDHQGQIGTSLVAENDGRVIGFIMGKIYMGEFGIPESTASLDTVGLDPEFAGNGIGSLLLDEFIRNVKAAGVTSIQTMVVWSDIHLLRFFNKNGFVPSQTINLERKV